MGRLSREGQTGKLRGNAGWLEFFEIMTNKKVNQRLPKFLESLGTGVMAYWSVEKKDVHPFVITPTLQYSNTPKLIEIES